MALGAGGGHDRACRRRLAGGGGRLRRLLRQPVRRRLGRKPDGAGHGAGSEAAGQRDGRQPGVVYASEQVHMSIPKAVAMLGHRQEQSAADPGRRRVPHADRRAPGGNRRRPPGRGKPIAIVATVGTVETGAIDPLPEIADICAQREICGCMSTAPMAAGGIGGAGEVPTGWRWPIRCRSMRINGSTSRIDCGCLLLVPRCRRARQTFSNSDDYVRIFSEDPTEGFAFFEESFELSRRFRALKLWMSLQYHGRRAFREAILRDLRHAQLLAETIHAQARAGTAGAGDAERGLLPPSQRRTTRRS